MVSEIKPVLIGTHIRERVEIRGTSSQYEKWKSRTYRFLILSLPNDSGHADATSVLTCRLADRVFKANDEDHLIALLAGSGWESDFRINFEYSEKKAAEI